MLNHAVSIGVAAFLLSLASCSKQTSPSISYDDELPLDGDWSITKFPNDKEEQEISRFVASIPGIDHRVQEIAVKSPTDIRVKTGRTSPLDGEHDRQGDSVRLRKIDGRWTVVEQSRWSEPAEKDSIYIWDGTSELAMVASVTDSATHKPISGATVRAVRLGGRDTEPLTHEHPSAMPPAKKTGRDGRAKLVAYFRSAGDAQGFSVFVGDSFLQIDAPGYQSRRVRISPIVRLDFAPKTKHCELALPVALTH